MSAAIIQVILIFLGLLGLVFIGFIFFNILMVLKTIEDHIERFVNSQIVTKTSVIIANDECEDDKENK